MSDNLQELIDKGNRVKDLVNNVPGWKDIVEVFDGIRKEAFQDWTTLNLNATPEQVLNIRAKELVVRDILERIETIVRLGQEAQVQMEGGGESPATFDIKPETPGEEEINRLFRPLRKWYTDLVHVDNPRNGADKTKVK